MPLDQVSNIILVLSGKGGVGKSSVTTQLALTFAHRGYNVGVLDLDITGPNAPRFFGVEDRRVVGTAGGGIGAVLVSAAEKQTQNRGALSVMSLGFILPSRGTAVIWRGPKKTAMVRQFLTDTVWPTPIDVLLIDTPPGTSDEHISLIENLHKEAVIIDASFHSLSQQQQQQSQSHGLPRLLGAVVVTTPQAVSTADVRKELSFCKSTRTPVLGILENMAGFVCPHCAECSDVFSRGGGEVMAQEVGVPFLGRCPIDLEFGKLIEENTGDPSLDLISRYRHCALAQVFDGVTDKLEEILQT